MNDFEPRTFYLVYALRKGRGWKLAHGNLHTEATAFAQRELIGQQEDVERTRLVRITNETLIEG